MPQIVSNLPWLVIWVVVFFGTELLLSEEKFLRVLDPFVADLIGGDFLGPGPPCVGTGDS